MRGQQEWRDRNTERKEWNLAKFQVVQRREKIGRIRRKTKVTGLEETEKESKKKKNRPEKTEETGSASTGERQHQQPFSGRRWTRLFCLFWPVFFLFAFLFCLFQTCHLRLPSNSSDLFPSLYYLELCQVPFLPFCISISSFLLSSH